MKREAATHPKMHDLAARLEITNAHALGLLQGLVWFTADHAIDGAVGKWADAAIARGSGWEGDPGHFVQSLLAAGWLDLHGRHRLIMHDWPDHCESWVRAKMAKTGLEFLACYSEHAEGTAEQLIGLNAQLEQPMAPTADRSGECTADGTAECTAEHTGDATADGGGGRSTNRTEPNRTKPNQKKRAKMPDLPQSLDTPAMQEAWRRWWKYRGDRRLTRSPTTMDAQLAAMQRAGPAASVAAIDASIQAGWQGVFPDAKAGPKTPNRSRARRHE